jgi:hypothetical protein
VGTADAATSAVSHAGDIISVLALRSTAGAPSSKTGWAVVAADDAGGPRARGGTAQETRSISRLVSKGPLGRSNLPPNTFIVRLAENFSKSPSGPSLGNVCESHAPCGTLSSACHVRNVERLR